MSIIVLPKDVASKIAAGEVVERPVSVVKELLENAIDAGATEISIRIEHAGKKLIEVIDNGEGITYEESDRALMRYATSKISTAEDLENVRTLGFRGEALASIAAVSRFMIESRSGDERTGFNSVLEGGDEMEKKPIGRAVGTLVRVEDLFFNVPARLKFLKKDFTERRLIILIVSRYALSYAGIRFSLIMEGKKVLVTNGNDNRREILSQLYDLETAKSLLAVDYSDDYLQIEGYTCPLNITRATRKEMVIFINGRLVSNPVIASAIMRGYHGLLMVGRFPITCLFIKISPSEVDVNVHPTKAEIKIKNPNRVFSAVQRIIRKTIVAYAPYAAVPTGIWKTPDLSKNVGQPEIGSSNSIDSVQRANLSQQPKSIVQNPPFTSDIPLLKLIGQLGLTYIAAEGPDGLYLIDQHAAHERILFEKISNQSEDGKVSQLLLEPVVVDLPAFQFGQLEQQLGLLIEIGFQLEPFGPGAYKVKAVPQVFSSMNPKEALLGALNDDQNSPQEQIDLANKNKMILRICKRLATKGGQVLSIQEQKQLIRDLENCKNPRTCPHGRPTMIHISVDMLERQFGRRGSV